MLRFKCSLVPLHRVLALLLKKKLMRSSKSAIRVGTGAGFSDDRIEPAVDLAERGKLDYLVFECLAERTIARENLTRLKNPELGYTPYLVERFQAVLPACTKNGIRIVTNMGAANPLGAARAVRREAKALGIADLAVAVVSGDDVAEIVRRNPQLPLMENGEPVESLLPRMASANAYLGADVICEGLATGAPVVMTGRVADPSLFLGTMLHGLGWSYNDYPRLAVGTLAGHMMECEEKIVRERLRQRGFTYPEIRVDYIGMSSLHGMGEGRPEPYEVRLRIAARSP